MLYFKNDYQEGCAKEILEALTKTNLEATIGYGFDQYSQKAEAKIKALLDIDCDIHFLIGGTQTNLCAISVLRPYEAVISCNTGHINVHEAGAIELTGHKVITTNNINGKIDFIDLEKKINEHSDIHMVIPKMVYISNSTELGTIYTKKDLEQLRKICDKYKLYLYIDGARLAQALTAKSNDLTMKDIANYADIFYIGGTKNGALFGEALIIKKDELKPHFKNLMKQRGAVLAKGRLLGIQFLTLFTNDLYYNLAKHANTMADELRNIFAKYKIKHYVNSDTNQIFPIISKELYNYLKDKVEFEIQETKDEQLIVRFVTSFATTKEQVENFANVLANYYKY